MPKLRRFEVRLVGTDNIVAMHSLGILQSFAPPRILHNPVCKLHVIVTGDAWMPFFETAEIFSHFLGIDKLPFGNAPAQFFKILDQPVFGLAEHGRLLVPAPFASAEKQSVSLRFLVLDYLDLCSFFGLASRDIHE